MLVQPIIGGFHFSWFREKNRKETKIQRKREKSLEKEKNFRKKENFFRRDFFPEKILFFSFCPLLMLFLLFWCILIVLTHPMLPFSCLITLFQEYLEKNVWKENFLLEKRLFSGKNFSWKNSLFLRFFSFSLSLCKFSFKMFLMKPSL